MLCNVAYTSFVLLLTVWGDAGGSVGTVQNIMGVLYSCTTFLGMFNMMSVMPILGYERSVMYRSVLLPHSSSSFFFVFFFFGFVFVFFFFVVFFFVFVVVFFFFSRISLWRMQH